jgi:hypothetical protein
MQIEIKKRALYRLNSIANWVEDKNTEGSGKRFLVKFYEFIFSQSNAVHAVPLCKFPEFKIRQLKCLFFNDWVIACKADKNKIVISTIIHGSWLNY